MNIKLLVAAFAFTATCYAQNLTFAEPMLKNKLLYSNSLNGIALNAAGQSIKIDANSDNEIQASEAALVHTLNMNYSLLHNLEGLGGFVNLKVLNAAHNDFTHVLGTQLPDLEVLNIPNCYIQTIDVTNLTNLKELVLADNLIAGINVAPLTQLKRLSIGHNIHIDELNYASNILTSLNIEHTAITSFNAADFPSLEIFSCGGTDIPPVNFQAIPGLKSFICYECHLEHVDLSHAPELVVVLLTNSTYLRTINLKNNNVAEIMDEWLFDNLQLLEYMCVDEGEKAWFDMIFANYPPDMRPAINTYCTADPGGLYDTVTGTVKYDAEGNGCVVTDPGVPNLKLLINDGNTTGAVYTDENGKYTFYANPGTYTITPQFENNYFNAATATQTVVVNNVTNATHTHNFCTAPNGSHQDVSIVMVPTDAARPGFNAPYSLLLTNNGNLPASGIITLTYQDAVLDLVSANFTPTLSPNTLTYTYTALQPFETRELNLVYNVNSPMENPALNNGDVLAYTVAVSAAADDNTANNMFVLNQTVVGSYDPNDIVCLDGETVHPDKIGQYLHYNINFENTGTAAATFIVVEDVIDADKFDVSSLQTLSTSHPVAASINGNKVIFRFDDINLPAQGKGNVVFKIKTLPTVAVNSTVTQNASIFFDYNWPIITNNANTTFTVLGTSDINKDLAVRMYPNPASESINVQAASELQTIYLYDVQGRIIISKAVVGSNTTLDISFLPKGMYFVKVLAEGGAALKKIIKE